MRLSDKWKDYELIDTSDGERLERWGDIILIRPDPQIIWSSEKEKSSLVFGTCPLPPLKSWRRKLGAVQKSSRPLDCKLRRPRIQHQAYGIQAHGCVPEQAVNWDFAAEKLKTKTDRLKFSTFSVTQVVQLLRV